MQLDLSKKYQVLLGEDHTLKVCLVGVGGTGSALALSLGRLAYHLKEKGVNVNMTFIDHDIVEETNIGRQSYCVSERGWNKSETIALRLNTAFGLSIRAAPVKFCLTELREAASFLSDWWGHGCSNCLLIGAVDNYLARREIAKAVEQHSGSVWWLDCGNAHHNGQVLIGNYGRRVIKDLRVDELGLVNGLPAPHLQAPDLLEPDPSDNLDLSCAELTVREEQSLMVNQMVAAIASQYCYEFLVRRRVMAYESCFTLEPPTTITKQISEHSFNALIKKINS
ncbi:MAG: ThiF family adenylyltransferase [Ardenticatenaceae bacterium]